MVNIAFIAVIFFVRKSINAIYMQKYKTFSNDLNNSLLNL